MQSLKKITALIIISLLSSCAMVAEKRSEKVDKETKFLSPLLNSSEKELITRFGQPTRTLKEGNQNTYVYEIKGRIFDCQRKFYLDNKNIVTGFESTCWD